MDIYELREFFKQHKKKPKADLKKNDTALMLIDVQKLAGPEYLEWACKEKFKMSEEEYGPAIAQYSEYFGKSLKNIGKVLTAARSAGIPVIHVKIEEYLDDCNDACAMHKFSGLLVKKDNPLGAFYPESTPIEGEIVLNKQCSGALSGTNVNFLLHNMGITNVILIGYYTNECITTTARDLADNSYIVTLITDATGALTDRLHERELDQLIDVYARGETTEGIIERLAALK